MTGRDDFYQTLGVNRKASAEAIRKAYRRLARKYHPDFNPGDKAAEERFKKATEAYEVLSEPKKREMYDRLGYYAETASHAGSAGSRAQRPVDFSGFDFSDWPGTETGAGGFRDVFSQFFRRAEPEPPRAERGSDLEYHVQIGFWDAIRGTTVRLNVMRQKPCPSCQGKGGTGREITCPECKGAGNTTKMMANMRFTGPCPRCRGAGRAQDHCTGCPGGGRGPGAEGLEGGGPAGGGGGSRGGPPGRGRGRGGGPRSAAVNLLPRGPPLL